MSIQDLGSIGELIAAIATLGTLIYLALQIRQNTKTQQSAIAQATTASRTTWYDLVISNPEIGEIWRIGHADPDSLSEQEKSRFIWMISRIFSNLEEFYLQFEHGMLPEEQWRAYRDFGRTMLENPFIIEWWKSGTAIFAPGFVVELSPDVTRATWTGTSMDELHTKKSDT
ncbi:MAG: hypothetical protein ACI9UU_001039 [Candidatus Azotimanducaceae bacterium]